MTVNLAQATPLQVIEVYDSQALRGMAHDDAIIFTAQSLAMQCRDVRSIVESRTVSPRFQGRTGSAYNERQAQAQVIEVAPAPALPAAPIAYNAIVDAVSEFNGLPEYERRELARMLGRFGIRQLLTMVVELDAVHDTLY